MIYQEIKRRIFQSCKRNNFKVPAAAFDNIIEPMDERITMIIEMKGKSLRHSSLFS